MSSALPPELNCRSTVVRTESSSVPSRFGIGLTNARRFRRYSAFAEEGIERFVGMGTPARRHYFSALGREWPSYRKVVVGFARMPDRLGISSEIHYVHPIEEGLERVI